MILRSSKTSFIASVEFGTLKLRALARSWAFVVSQHCLVQPVDVLAVCHGEYRDAPEIVELAFIAVPGHNASHDPLLDGLLDGRSQIVTNNSGSLSSSGDPPMRHCYI